MPFACLLALPCPALPSPLRQVGFTDGLVVTSQGVAEKQPLAELLSAECWVVAPTPAHLAGLGFPRRELGSGPGLPQGLARGQRPGCWLHIGSPVPAGPVARLLCGSVYRKSWTSAQRYHLFWASSSATPTSHRAPRNMRKLKVGRLPAGEQPR